MQKQVLLLTLALVAMLSLADRAAACTCMDLSSPCTSFRDTAVVFVGVVTSIEEQKTEIMRFGEKESIRTGLLAHFTVEDPLKGIQEKTIDVATGGGGGDCGYPFKSGERYLVYAYTSQAGALNSAMSRTVLGRSGMAARLQTTICTRTRPLRIALDDIELIRGLNQDIPQMRIFGHVSLWARKLGIYEYGMDSVGPMSGVTIKAEGAGGSREATTDSNGRYVFTVLKPGLYKLTPKFPEGYASLYDFRTQGQIQVTAETCGGEVDFSAQVDGRISGHVFDAGGRPVNNDVQVSVVSLESAEKGMALRESRSEYTKKEGWYEFDGLLPGKYLIGVSVAEAPDKHSPYPTIFYPRAGSAADAQVFTLTAGQKMTGIDLHLPAQLSEIKITGVVLLPNGNPVEGADIDIYDEEDPSHQLGFGADVETDKQGRFTIRGLKGRRYLLHAWKAEDYLAGTGVQSAKVRVETTDGASSLKLILNQPGIFQRDKNEKK